MLGGWLLLLTHFTVPAFLLWAGHRYRECSVASRRFFWGGVVGYVLSMMVVTTLLVIPPVFWGAPGGGRWLAIQWTPLVLPLVAATGARLASRG